MVRTADLSTVNLEQSVPQYLKADCRAYVRAQRVCVRTTITKSSPVGTADLSPGCSPGLAGAMEKSRRACPELVERGRLKKLLKPGPGFGQRIGNSQSRNISRWKCLGAPPANSSRPYGTCRLSDLHPGPRPGLSSAVPAGLILCNQ